MTDDDETYTELVSRSLIDNPEAAPEWTAIMLANIADSLEDIVNILERLAPRPTRARRKR